MKSFSWWSGCFLLTIVESARVQCPDSMTTISEHDFPLLNFVVVGLIQLTNRRNRKRNNETKEQKKKHDNCFFLLWDCSQERHNACHSVLYHQRVYQCLYPFHVQPKATCKNKEIKNFTKITMTSSPANVRDLPSAVYLNRNGLVAQLDSARAF